MTPEEELDAAEAAAQERYPLGTRVTFADGNVLAPLGAPDAGRTVVAEGLVNGSPVAVPQRDETGTTVIAIYVRLNVRRPGMSDASIAVHEANVIEATPPGARQ